MIHSLVRRGTGVAGLFMFVGLGFGGTQDVEEPAVKDGAQEISVQWRPADTCDRLPYLHGVQATRDGRTLTVTVSGSLPDAAYEQEPIEARLAGRLIVLLPRVKRGSGFGAQVLRPFESTCRLILPDDEAFTLTVLGRDRTHCEEIPAATR